MTFRKTLLPWMPLAALTAMSPVRAQQAPSHIPDAGTDAAIRAVVEDFRTAILQRDKARFLSLFLHDRVVWQDVAADATVQRARVKNPNAQKVRVDFDDSPTAFINSIAEDKNSSEETFDNLVIQSDGDIAAVSFDYRFLSNGKETNHGLESWQLVRTAEGWKIVSVIWSVRLRPKA